MSSTKGPRNNMRIRFHYNKFGAAKGLPWTLHTSKACMAASHVRFEVPLETEEKPNKRSNPRFFLVVDGNIEWNGTVATIHNQYEYSRARACKV